ncbi:MAG TPA: ATP-binding protein [Mycobacteriales bacterium]|nr:ATP-binding protein [Mycobacteriales bacterium]
MAQPDRERLDLAANPAAVGQARTWLAGYLSGWSSDGLATVQLLLSELVTNAILHTTDVVEVAATRAGAVVTIEVSDHNPSKPVLKTYQQDAATGRGLHLVEALAEEWGVHADAMRKSVWFRVADGASRSGPGHQVTSRDAYDSEPVAPAPAAAPPGTLGGPAFTVWLRGLPVATYLAVEEHHDALVREFALLLQSGTDHGGGRVAPGLLVLAAKIVEQFGVGNEERRAQVEAARRAGKRTVDVSMLFPSGSHAQVALMADQLDEADASCRRGELLTPPSTPEVVRFRRWYTDEIVRQLSGQAATSWPYGVDEPAPSGGTNLDADRR